MKARSKNRSRPVAGKAVQPHTRRDLIVLALLVLLLSGIYLGKAYNMDDPLVLWTAQRIAAHPADFYGFDVNWYGYNSPIEQTDLNPPGAAYYSAIFGSLFHWHESAIHGAAALIAVVLILGIYWLARQMGGEPLPAAVIALVSPGVFVSMGTVMTDLLMTALWVWAIVLWLRGLHQERPSLNAASALLIGLAALSKYFAFSLVPLLMLYTLFFGRKRWARLTWLTIPVAMVWFFEMYTKRLYGIGQIQGILEVYRQYHELYAVNVGRKFLTGLTFLGASAAPVLFLAPWLWRGAGKGARRIALWVGVIGIALAWMALQQNGWHPGEPQVSFSWWFWLQYGLWLLAGIHIIALTAVEIWTRRDRDAMLVGFWVGGTLFYCIFMYQFVNVRVILPAVPAIVLVCAWRLRRTQEKQGIRELRSLSLFFLPLGASLLLSVCVAQADIKLANSARTAAATIAPEKRSGITWFSGHWGFQYYMEARGGKPIDMKHQNFRWGDTVVTPMNATNRFLTQPRVAVTDQSFELPVCSWITTMRAQCGAGFYADLWGPLPFVFGPVPAERYNVIVLGRR